jgi:carbon monoxide dehydrogenase subunit G
MELIVEKRFSLPVSVEQAWAVLSDVRSVAACMPGARIDEPLEGQRFRGALDSEVGPSRVHLEGAVEMTARDAVRREVQLTGQGAGASGLAASMDVTARLEATGFADECRLVGRAALTVDGELAQLGPRVLGPASDAVLSLFARNFTAAARAVPDPGAKAAARARAGPESTLTLLVQAGQAPGAAVAPHSDGSAKPEPGAKTAAARVSVKERLRRWFGR